MPLDQDPGQSGSDKYCSYCYKDGKFTYEGDLKGFQQKCYEGMRAHGMSHLKAKFFTWMVRFAPRWRGAR